MIDTSRKIKEMGCAVLKLLPFLSFIPPIFTLYLLEPLSFEYTWKGRTYYLFFMWTIFLETILSWNTLEIKSWKRKPFRVILFLIVLLLPTIYVLFTNFVEFYGYQNFNAFIVALARKCGISGEYFTGKMPLAIEYLIFTVIFVIIILTFYSLRKLGKYALSTFLLGLTGFIYLVDNLFPYGNLVPLQMITLLTAILASYVLNVMGYKATITTGNDPIYGFIPGLSVEGLKDPYGRPYPGSVWIAWPCSGVDSLLIYSVTLLMFLKGGGLSRKQKIFFFVFGAVVTYLLNILRVITFIMIGTTSGVGSNEWWRFHDYYGPLYSITWIVLYPLVITAAHSLLTRSKRRSSLSL